jgi:anti-sigma regulatory factor (Ser/Thr protein kinase)
MEPMGGVTRHAAAEQLAADGGPSASPVGGAFMPLTHVAVFYRTASSYARQVGDFVRAGLPAAEPTVVAAPGPLALILRDELGDDARVVTFADTATAGGAPGRAISAIQAFIGAHDGTPVRYVREPVRRPRTEAQIRETLRTEVLINVAFAGRPLHVLCPYDAAALDPQVLIGAEQAHPALMVDGAVRDSPAFTRSQAWPELDEPLAPAPATADVLIYQDDPGEARRFVRQRARTAGLPDLKITDLVLAVGELAANTLRHTRGPGTVRVWRAGREVICELADKGFIRDPLAGRLCPEADAGRGHGLWVVHQVCDLVEMRTNGSGTTFRLHMGLDGQYG